MKRIKKVLVMGGGSAGLLAALAIERQNPKIGVRVVASKKRGTIGVGEGTVPYVVKFVTQYLGFDEAAIYQALDPVYKLGVRFDWGKGEYYDYTFSSRTHVQPVKDLRKVSGYYVGDDVHGMDMASALMNRNFALPSKGAGKPDVPPPGEGVAWHLENHRFVSWLESACKERGIEFIDAEVEEAVMGDDGDLKGLKIESGAVLKADLFVDSSGFNSALLGGALEEEFVSYSNDLFCDKAVVGGWDRGSNEEILPYTLAETMEAGWSWRIDHPERVNRGYVFCSSYLSDEDAEKEFRQKNPKIDSVRIIKFQSGRRKRVWVRNVVGIGNAAGFVEPLEGTAIMCSCFQAQWLADGLRDSCQEPPETMRSLYNDLTKDLWDEIRDFLSLHYHFNDKLDSDFWKMARKSSSLGVAAKIVEFFKENGPSSIGEALIPSSSPFGVVGYYAHLLGMRVKGSKFYRAEPAEQRIWTSYVQRLEQVASNGLTMEQLRSQLMEPAVWKQMRGV